MTIVTLLGIGALICFPLATFGVQTKINLVALGLALFVLSFLL